MQRLKTVSLAPGIVLTVLFALNTPAFAQVTFPVPGMATNPGSSMPQNPGGVAQPDGTAIPNSVREQPPKRVNPNLNPIVRPKMTPNSRLPNQNPSMVPSPYPKTVPTVPSPDKNPSVEPRAITPNITPGHR